LRVRLINLLPEWVVRHAEYHKFVTDAPGEPFLGWKEAVV